MGERVDADGDGAGAEGGGGTEGGPSGAVFVDVELEEEGVRRGAAGVMEARGTEALVETLRSGCASVQFALLSLCLLRCWVCGSGGSSSGGLGTGTRGTETPCLAGGEGKPGKGEERSKEDDREPKKRRDQKPHSHTE